MYPLNLIWSHQKGSKLSLAFSILGLYEILSSSFFLVNSCCWPRRRRSYFFVPFSPINRLRRKWKVLLLTVKINSIKCQNFDFFWCKNLDFWNWIKENLILKGRRIVFIQRGYILSAISIQNYEILTKKLYWIMFLNFFTV